jgi:acyl carrier protein
MDVYSEVKELIARECALGEEDVVSEAHLQNDLGADSLALLNLSVAVGKRYGIEVQSDDLVEIENVGELVNLIESRMSAK